jgi:hypothetical protein
MYDFFVADEVPVPSWRQTPPKDVAAINLLEKAYFDSGYDITAMLRVLFTSDFFKAPAVRYARVKSPAELVASILRMTGEHYGDVQPGLFEISQEPGFIKRLSQCNLISANNSWKKKSLKTPGRERE